MIKTIEISNYQAHKSSCLDLHPGVNVITGSSDSGKSAILRALIWGLKNRPSGGDFKSWYASDKDTVEVSVEFDNGWFIKERKGTKNKYQTEEGTFEALRSDVPEFVQKLANIGEFNLQTQYQKYFMLQDSPGDRAKVINEITGLGIVDKLFKHLNSKISHHKSILSHQTTEHERITAELAELEFLDGILVLKDDVKKDLKEYEKCSGRVSQIQETIRLIHQCDTERTKLKKVLDIQPAHEELSGLLDKHTTQSRHASMIETMLADWKYVEGNKTDTEDWLEVEGDFLKITAIQKDYDNLIAKTKRLELAFRALSDAGLQVERATRSLHSSINTYTDLLKKSGVCPTCKSKIDNKTIELVTKSLKEIA